MGTFTVTKTWKKEEISGCRATITTNSEGKFSLQAH